MTLVDFAADFRQEILSESNLEGSETLRSDSFTARMIQELTDAGELDDGNVAYFKGRGMEVSGYSISDDGRRLDLIAAAYTGSSPPMTVGKAEVETAITRLLTFLDRARGDLVLSVEESTPEFDMVVAIRDLEALERVRLFVVTDGLTTVTQRSPERRDDLEVSYHVWDIQRLFQCVTSGQQQESIDIDFVREFGHALPCLKGNDRWADYTAYLAIVPGEILAAIYERYGTRLLERNVRAFLQTRGKVNQGIRKTILNEPDRFLAYNNGISATASEVVVGRSIDGGLNILAVSDLQIVNGGQTTASLHYVARREKIDISHIAVQAKLTVVPPDKLTEIVPLISRYANSQNKVNDADFEANSPFHIRIENWSRTVWAPAVGGSQLQTRWFYERARGQYQDALAQAPTPAKARQFKVLHPTAQKFSKTDLAKFENTWDQLPHFVSLGAEKSFRQFTDRLVKRGAFPVTQEYFERLVAKAILFRRAEKIVSQQNFGGYRANIVTYTVAYLSYVSDQQIDLDRIWASQDLTPSLAAAIETSCHEVREVLLDAPGNGNITEWCKKMECWHRVRELRIHLPKSFENQLVSAAYDPWRMSELVLNALAESRVPLGRADLLDRSGIPLQAWSATMRSLIEKGLVVRVGQRRTAVYELAE